MPLNQIKRPINFVYKSNDFYFNFIKNNPTLYHIMYNDVINVIDKIKLYNKDENYKNEIIKNFLYFLYKYSIKNDIENPLDYSDGGMPNGGFEFFNKNTHNRYSIYHCHLSEKDSSILIWYPIMTEKNKYFIHIEYMKHPSNSQYEQIIKDIYYRNDGGYNINEYDYFFNVKHILPDSLYENKILKFKDFTKKMD